MAFSDTMPKVWQMYGMSESLGVSIYNTSTQSLRDHFGGLRRRLTIHNPAGAAQTIHPQDSSSVYLELTENCTISLDKYATITCVQDVVVMLNVSSFTATFDFTIQWDGGSAPAFTANTFNMVRLWTIDNWATVFGQSLVLGATYTPSVTAVKAYASYAGSTTGIIQLNMATESTSVAAAGVFGYGGQPNTPRVAANVVGGGYCLILGYDTDSSIYSYATGSLGRAPVFPYSRIIYGSVMAVDPREGYAEAAGISTTGSGGGVVHIMTTTMALVYGAVDTAQTRNATYQFTTFSSAYSAIFIGGNWSGVMGLWTKYNFVSKAMYNYTNSLTTYAHACWACDAEDTKIGYMFGGKTSAGVSSTAIHKYDGTASTFVTIGSTLPVALNSATDGVYGMGHDGINVWSYRPSNPFTFTVATETVAVGVVESRVYKDRFAVHGDTFLS